MKADLMTEIFALLLFGGLLAGIVWMLRKIGRNPALTWLHKFLWTLLVLFTFPLGPLLYWYAAPRQTRASLRLSRTITPRSFRA